jgi:diacylglycerol O-acyltransferase 1
LHLPTTSQWSLILDLEADWSLFTQAVNMSTLIDTAISTSTQLPKGPLSQRTNSTSKSAADHAPTPRKGAARKYNHVFAVHHRSIASPLSQDAKIIPSFVGFKNLMALMLGKLPNVLN